MLERAQLAGLAIALTTMLRNPHPAEAAAGSRARNVCPVSAPIEIPPALLPEGPWISVDALRADFQAWMTGTAATNPDLSVRTDQPAFEQMRAEIERSLVVPMTQREAWLQFARINPTLRDGHSGILLTDYRRSVRDYLSQGGRIAPFQARIDDNGAMHISAADPTTGLTVGERVISINGHDANRIVEAMLAVTEGDTPEFRRAFAARRFQFLYWMIFGDTGHYAIEVETAGCVRTVLVDGARDTTALTVETPFSADILEGGIGYIRAASFAGEHRETFAAFARQAFTEFKANSVRALIIDVRDNSGGDDPLWQESLMEYVTTRPYSHVGAYAVRITHQNADPGDVIGDVQRSTYDRRFTPSSDNPLRLDVPVFVLKGAFTYSSAIQFVVAAQDFGVAKIAGPESGALACQTGRITDIPLPSPGLRAFTPVMIFTRPSGTGCDQPIRPDIPLVDDELHPERAVEELAEKIRTGAI